MATMFAQPLTPFVGPSSPTAIRPNSAQPYTSQAQFTPPSSSDNNVTSSPLSSPHTSFGNNQLHIQMPARQIRQPKTTMTGYVPAALRKTEKPVRSSPPRYGLNYGSPDSIMDLEGVECPAGVATRLSRIVTEEWNERVLGPVTGAPSRNHWKPDTASPTCDDNTCDKDFNWINRRHHCRRCGRIFCWEHSSHFVPLDQHARFHPQGNMARSCNACWSDYRAWETARVSRTNSTNSRDGTAPGTPSIAMPSRPVDGAPKNSVAASFSNAWNWSTF